MRYERRKVITAVFSVLSVSLAITGAIASNILFASPNPLINQMSILFVAAILAAIAASTSIVLSQRLSKKREQQQIFLIYAREDIEATRKLAADLAKNGYKPWLDVDEIVPGEVWQNAVLRALEQSTVALVIVSIHLSKQGFVQQELDFALSMLPDREHSISPVIPVRIDYSDVPENLSHIQWVNLFEEDGLETLLTGINKGLSQMHRRPFGLQTNFLDQVPDVRGSSERVQPNCAARQLLTYQCSLRGVAIGCCVLHTAEHEVSCLLEAPQIPPSLLSYRLRGPAEQAKSP